MLSSRVPMITDYEKICSLVKSGLNFLIFLIQGYTICMDMWSVGCILAEMVSNRPIFPGKNYLDLIEKIQAVLGSPTPADTEFIKNPKARSFLTGLPKRNKVEWGTMYKVRTESDRNYKPCLF